VLSEPLCTSPEPLLGLGMKNQPCFMQLRSTSFRFSHPPSVWCSASFPSYTLGDTFPVWISDTVFLLVCLCSFLVLICSRWLVGAMLQPVYVWGSQKDFLGAWSETCCTVEPRPHLIATQDFPLMLAVGFEAIINSEPSASIISCGGFDHSGLVPSIFYLVDLMCHH